MLLYKLYAYIDLKYELIDEMKTSFLLNSYLNLSKSSRLIHLHTNLSCQNLLFNFVCNRILCAAYIKYLLRALLCLKECDVDTKISQSVRTTHEIQCTIYRTFFLCKYDLHILYSRCFFLYLLKKLPYV